MFEVFLTNRAEKVIKSFDNTKLSRRIEEVIVTLSHTYFPKGYDTRKHPSGANQLLAAAKQRMIPI